MKVYVIQSKNEIMINYCQYVDDIFLMFEKKDHMKKF